MFLYILRYWKTMTHHVMVMDKLPGREKLYLDYSLIEILVVKFHSSSTELILFS